VPTGPGLGVDVDEDFLTKITASVRTLRRPG
jgi:L-alanine-DL-glutamate epimerase-like enolase superfamily enzyme